MSETGGRPTGDRRDGSELLCLSLGYGGGGGVSPSCYICMDEAESDQDALIAPCQCKGSTALVHVKCLQRLLSTGDAHKVGRRQAAEGVDGRL